MMTTRRGLRPSGLWTGSSIGASTILLTLVGAAPSPASAQDTADSVEQQLVERLVMLEAQQEACDPDGEPYAPSSVDIVLDNREVLPRRLIPA